MGEETDAAREPDLIPVRMLNEYVYCPRLAYLEWVQGEFEDNADTVEGRFRHRRVDAPSGKLPSPGEDGSDATASGTEEGTTESRTLHARSVTLSSASLGLIAKMDLVETDGQRATPVDYKRGSAPDIPAGAWEPERVQVCAQGLILRDNGFACNGGVIYFTASKTRVEVAFDEELVERTRDAIQDLRRVAAGGTIPPPLVDSPKCPRCSLVGICLPDEVNLLSGRPDAHSDVVRSMAAAKDEGLPLYVGEQGAHVGLRGDTLEIRVQGKPVASMRRMEVSQVNVVGNVQVSAQAIRDLAGRNVPICHFSYGGWFSAITSGMVHKNVELRRRQFAVAEDPDRCLQLAKSFVEGKIRNTRTLLRRNHPSPPVPALRELARLGKQARGCASEESLLGVEGAAARMYFAHLQGMLKEGPTASFDFKSRNRRPPKDPVNAMLSFVYALLVKDLTVAVLAVGFDPLLGFYHKPRYGRPSLALDLAEEFRPLIGDSTVLTALNGGEVREADFVSSAGAVAMTPRCRRQVIAAYERRMDTLVTHPVFGYPISYRKVLYIQARLLARFLAGEIQRYPAFCTR
jgi:CRISPR-associated protein Cas1